LPDSLWKTLGEETLIETPHLSVVKERCTTPTRANGESWLNVRRKQAVVIAPRTPDQRFILIHQERIPARRMFWEFPAGQIESAVTESSIRETALRELREEAGYAPRGGDLHSLGCYFSSPGFTNEFMHLFAALDVEPHADGNQPDESERIHEVRAFSAAEFCEMMRVGEIQDANTLCLAAKLLVFGLMKP